jgi:hypothetical protein
MKTERYSLQRKTTSSLGNDDPVHENAMSSGMREVKLRGFHVRTGWPLAKDTWKTSKGYKFQTRARFQASF